MAETTTGGAGSGFRHLVVDLFRDVFMAEVRFYHVLTFAAILGWVLRK